MRRDAIYLTHAIERARRCGNPGTALRLERELATLRRTHDDEEEVTCCADCGAEVTRVSTPDREESLRYCEACQAVEPDVIRMTRAEYDKTGRSGV